MPLPCTNTSAVTSDLISRDINATDIIPEEDEEDENDLWLANATNTTANVNISTAAVNTTSTETNDDKQQPHEPTEHGADKAADETGPEEDEKDEEELPEIAAANQTDIVPEISTNKTQSDQEDLDLEGTANATANINGTSAAEVLEVNVMDTTMNVTNSTVMNATSVTQDLELLSGAALGNATNMTNATNAMNATNATVNGTQAAELPTANASSSLNGSNGSSSESWEASAQYLERVHSMYASNQALGDEYGANGIDGSTGESDDSVDIAGVDDIGDNYRNDVENTADDDVILDDIFN